MVPLWILLALGAVQLALLQQARLLTEYAAYSAARAGIVWNGNGERMRDAALFALLPVLGPTGSLDALGGTYEKARAQDQWFHEQLAPTADAPLAFKQSGLRGQVQVDVLSPTSGGVEEEFDQGPSPESLLSLRLKLLYELRLPFVDAAIFHAWRASHPDAGPELAVLSSLASAGRYFVPVTATHSMRMQSAFHRKWRMHGDAP